MDNKTAVGIYGIIGLLCFVVAAWLFFGMAAGILVLGFICFSIALANSK